MKIHIRNWRTGFTFCGLGGWKGLNYTIITKGKWKKATCKACLKWFKRRSNEKY